MEIIELETLFKNHGKQIGAWQISAVEMSDGAVKLVISHCKKVGGTWVDSTVPIVRKNIGKANETSPKEQALLELQSRVNKQIDKGYVRTQEEAEAPATNSLGLLKPMLAQPINKVNPESIDWENAWAQPKLDGHRCLSNGILYSRGGKEITMPHILEALGDLGLLDLHLDGELYIHGMLLQDIGSLVKKLRGESAQLEYHLYDQISGAPYQERMSEVMDRVQAGGDSPIKLVKTCHIINKEGLDWLHRGFLLNGYEGTILRHGLGGYEVDKRSNALIKVKDFDEAEFEVMGVSAGTPRILPDGQVLQVPVWVCRNPAGLTEEAKTFEVTAAGDMYEKDQQWQDKASYMGRWLTVQFFGRSKLNVPLLPVALRWREDI